MLEAPPSKSRMVSMALIAAGPPPMMRCRVMDSGPFAEYRDHQEAIRLRRNLPFPRDIVVFAPLFFEALDEILTNGRVQLFEERLIQVVDTDEEDDIPKVVVTPRREF